MGCTALLRAVLSGHVEIVRFLVEMGAQLDVQEDQVWLLCLKRVCVVISGRRGTHTSLVVSRPSSVYYFGRGVRASDLTRFPRVCLYFVIIYTSEGLYRAHLSGCQQTC